MIRNGIRRMMSYAAAALWAGTFLFCMMLFAVCISLVFVVAITGQQIDIGQYWDKVTEFFSNAAL